MSQAQNNFSVNTLYQTVIEDVIAGVREAFLDEGVDEQVLQELKLLWESKLAASKALEKQSNNQAAGNQAAGAAKGGAHGVGANSQAAGQRAVPAQSDDRNTLMANLLHATNGEEMVSVQIKLPNVSGNPDVQRCVAIQVPVSAIQANKLGSILTPSVIDATLSLPAEVAAHSLQEKVLAALGHSNGGTHSQGSVIKSTSVITSQSQNQKYIPPKSSVHLDGGNGDSSDDDEEEEEDEEDDLDEDVDDKDDDIEEEQEGEGQDEEPLNSEDDVSDNEDSNDKLYEIDNVVVCQYDKITRSRNKWKFHLKDGIMNLNGTDYVFQKANGDAEW